MLVLKKKREPLKRIYDGEEFEINYIDETTANRIYAEAETGKNRTVEDDNGNKIEIPDIDDDVFRKKMIVLALHNADFAIEEEGKPKYLPCNDKTKIMFATEFPNLANKIIADARNRKLWDNGTDIKKKSKS